MTVIGTRPAVRSTRRDRQRQVLRLLEETEGVTLDSCVRLNETSCSGDHELRLADVLPDLLQGGKSGRIGLTRAGRDWVLEADRPCPRLERSRREVPPLRAWQFEALRVWCQRGRHGVVEAVTGTGRSRVGVEAARQALRHDYHVIVVVPTVDLVDQRVKAFGEAQTRGVGRIGDRQVATLKTHRVLVGTVQSLYVDPPVRRDRKVLLLADECHRYGAGQWCKALPPTGGGQGCAHLLGGPGW